MIFRVEFCCDTPAFSHAPPRDLLTETARVLRGLAEAVERGELDIFGTRRHLDDGDGTPIGWARFQ